VGRDGVPEMIKYSQEMKEQMVAKLLAPNGPSALKLSAETGIPQPTLSNWKRTLVVSRKMSVKSKNGFTLEEKAKLVFEALPLSESELGAFLRKNGLHSIDLLNWQEEIEKQLAVTSKKNGPGRPKKDPHLAAVELENKQLKKDLKRKNAALAEQTTLAILQKKAQAMWAEHEDEE
jgi:transposase